MNTFQVEYSRNQKNTSAKPGLLYNMINFSEKLSQNLIFISTSKGIILNGVPLEGVQLEYQNYYVQFNTVETWGTKN